MLNYGSFVFSPNLVPKTLGATLEQLASFYIQNKLYIALEFPPIAVAPTMQL